ncbi:DUF6383 domain-containing protein [Parabacteroides sp.]
MNKKFSTLLAGVALMGAFSANAIDNNKLYQLSAGEDGQVLSVVKSKVTSSDSLVVVDAPDTTKVMSEAYKKSLWKMTKGNTDNTENDVWTLTNWATGNVLSLDLTKNSGAFVAGKQSQWLISASGEITAIKAGEKYAIYLDEVKNKDGEVIDHAVKVKKTATAQAFVMTAPYAIEAMAADQINGLYGTSSVLSFTKTLEGNPIDGVAFRAVAIEGEDSYVNVRLNSGKYLVVDSAQWTNTVNDNVYFKLTTDALPTENADAAKSVNSAVEATLLKNGRAADFYAFKFKLDIAAGYVVTITPKGVPTYAPTTPAENKAHAGMSYDVKETSRALVYGKFANSLEVLTATAATTDKLAEAKATFGVAETSDALDADYTYYVQFYNKYKLNDGGDKWLSDSRYKKYEYLNCEGNKKEDAKASLETPAYMWWLTEDGSLKNMMAEDDDDNINGAITLIDEANGVYAFNDDTVKLTKGPKVEAAQKMGYKVVTKADEVNGALSFRLVSLLADDLYMIAKSGTMYVANSELADAQKLKVVAAEEAEEGEEAEYETVGNEVVKPVYFITDRLGKKVLVSKEGVNDKVNYELAEIAEDGIAATENVLKVSFLAMGKENQYKIVYGEDQESAITANAASGVLEEGAKCDDKNVIFEFATKEAPAYGAPAIGHVQITTLEDDNKMIANQKDGFAALKSVGQSLVDDVYTSDTLTMWLDTACVTFDETMPLYYISTKTFTPEAETRNFLINPANISADIEKNNEDLDNEEIENIYPFDKVEDSFRAAFAAATVSGEDTIVVNGEKIDLVELNPAAIAFEVAAEISDEAYRIVSKLHAKNEDYDAEDEESLPYVEEVTDMYLAQLNNVLFWTADAGKAEIFVINRASTPTSNEGIEAESSVKVIAGNGTVTVQGAAGQTVTIATVLGKPVAKEVVASDNATIAAPAGVVFVTVNGETTKVVVK